MKKIKNFEFYFWSIISIPGFSVISSKNSEIKNFNFFFNSAFLRNFYIFWHILYHISLTVKDISKI